MRVVVFLFNPTISKNKFLYNFSQKTLRANTQAKPKHRPKRDQHHRPQNQTITSTSTLPSPTTPHTTGILGKQGVSKD